MDSPKEEQIRKLVKKAVRRDTEAYGQLMEYYKEYLYRTAYLFTGNQEQALDIVGETILKGFRSIHKLKKPEYFRTWLTKILMNTANDCYRRYPEMEDLEALMGQAAAAPEAGITIEERLDLNDAVSRLPDKYREVIILKYFDELKISEIARVMGMPEGTVKAYLHRAKAELRKYYQ